MTNTDLSRDDNAYFTSAKNTFREHYNSILRDLQAAEKAFRNLIVLLLKDQQFPEPKVSSRIKEREECINKFVRKYREDLDKSGTDYVIADYITDIIGLRVVCYYESDVDDAVTILKDQLKLLEETNKTEELEKNDSEFGYKGTHLDLSLNEERGKFPEYAKFKDYKFEIQIRTIAQDAWSEVDHKLKYKKDLPPKLQRRVFRLAALFELADQEFQIIRDDGIQLEEDAKQPIGKQEEKNQPIDTIGFLRAVNSVFDNFPAYGDALSNLITEIRYAKPDINVAELKDSLENNIGKVEAYNAELTKTGAPMSPLTKLRHCLYISSPENFDEIIFRWQRSNFVEWLNNYNK